MSAETSQRAWVNFAWTEVYGYPFDDWAEDRIDRGVSTRQLAREVEAMTRDAAGVSPNTLTNWFPQLKSNTAAAA